MLRDLNLGIEKSQKDEEHSIRAELEKKHLGEQVEFRQKLADEQAKLRRQLIGDSQLVAAEGAAD
jgi:hypothetical protein